ncbi:PTS N-acetylglucosamine transporter subunit IIBC [Enterococcus hulanensis]|uniref:PTS sugar transporter subunit IIA n=1 Tax=Enterococcus TaxID=1350 RepID=UPI000B5AA4AD|nr:MULTISPECIES: hypothetical protein [Enterococcus]MBO0411496.1 PTS N-acetylglucosamine transporter subunit IIBC [Enterococcus hulanensis]OTO14247.1 hypothetical protein A5875_003404 [Enterococcus sp. 3H8_DIV0648]
MRKVLIATHAQMAEGIKSTAEFIIGEKNNLTFINAYINDIPFKDELDHFKKDLSKEDEVVILTDILAGSVNQEVTQLTDRPHTHVITGVNLPLVLGVALANDTTYLDADQLNKIIADAKEAIIYVNEFEPEIDEEDE